MPAASFTQQLLDYLRAGYPLLYVHTHEEIRALQMIAEAIQALPTKTQLVTWSVTGLCTNRIPGNSLPGPLCDVSGDPIEAIKKYAFETKSQTILVLKDFHPYLQDAQVTRALRDFVTHHIGRANSTILILSPIFRVPPEVEKDITYLELKPPDRETVGGILDGLVSGLTPDVREALGEYDREKIIEASLGLSETEIENVLALSAATKHKFDIQTILAEKKQVIHKAGLLEYYEPDVGLADVGGLEVLKEWLKKRKHAFGQEARDFGLPAPKGILLVGVPGAGKSLVAKVVGSYWQMPLLRFDMGKVFSSLVGSSEENMRRAIQSAEAIAPAVLWLEELEKSMAGIRSSGDTDSGVTSRVFGTFLTWLQEKTSSVFVVATANKVEALPPELLRKGR